ncbi:MAG: hypothetical protein WCG78_00975 [Candidatus Omnitrophota bacterium]
MLKRFRVFLAITLILAGTIGVACGIVEAMDPAGSKAADDSDPLGLPPSRSHTIAFTSCFAALAAAGIWLIRKKE